MLLKKLAELRRKNNLTQRQLAKKSGVKYYNLIKIERGAVEDPQVSTALKLAKALKVRIEDLL